MATMTTEVAARDARLHAAFLSAAGFEYKAIHNWDAWIDKPQATAAPICMYSFDFNITMR